MPRALSARGVLYLCFLILISVLDCLGAKKQVSLITAWPGSEIYELCGHEAIRISGPGIDSVWNFGVFDFNEPNFVYRFVKGETDYMVDSYPFAWFLPEYVKRGSRVEEQVLNLSDAEVEKIHTLLRKATLPPANRYRYNYIKNNCSTKIADLLDSVAGGPVVYTDTIRFDNYRDAMRGYHGNYPWYQFGIDVALGSGLEETLTPRKELFIPVEFNRHAASARLADGRPLVRFTNVLNQGSPQAIEGPTPFLLSPLWFSILVAALSLILIAIYWRKNCIPKWWYAIYFGLVGLAGCLVAFLVCISSHEATSPNLLIFWLNPLQLLIPIFIWYSRNWFGRCIMQAMMWLNVAAVGMLLVLMPIFDQGQAGQPALLVLIATDVFLALCWLKIANRHKAVANSDYPVSRKVASTQRKRSVKRKNATGSDKIIIRRTRK